MSIGGQYDPRYLIVPRDIRHQEQTFEEIWRAVMRFDMDRLRWLAAEVSPSRVRDANRNTLVHLCAVFGNSKAMSYFLREHGDQPDVNASNVYGTTALHIALERVQGDRYTPVHKEILSLLLCAGADPRLLNGLGNSALVAVAGSRCPDTLAMIYEKMLELEHSKYQLMKALVHAGWSLTDFFRTSDLDLIELMLVYDTEALRTTDAQDTSPLHAAVEARAPPAVFALLLKLGVDPNVAAQETLNTPLHEVCELAGQWDNLEIAEILLRAGANPNALNAKGCSSLHSALAYGGTELIKLMLSMDVDVHVVDNTKNTSLHFAAHSGHVEIIKTIVDMGLAVDMKNACGVTPLHVASRRGRSEAAEYLLRMGADVNWKDRRGWAALHYAVQSCSCEGPMHECVETVEVLVDYAAELDVEKPGEKSALGLCVDNKNVPFGCFLIRCLAMVEPRTPQSRALTIQLIEKNRMMMEYYDRCIEEIKTMKRKFLYGRITFFRALTCSMKDLMRFCRNPEYVEAMNEHIYSDYICMHFLVYRHRLTRRFVSAVSVQGPINDAIEALCHLTDNPDSTDEVLTTIVKYLETDELKTLGKCKLIIERELRTQSQGRQGRR